MVSLYGFDLHFPDDYYFIFHLLAFIRLLQRQVYSDALLILIGLFLITDLSQVLFLF